MDALVEARLARQVRAGSVLQPLSQTEEELDQRRVPREVGTELREQARVFVERALLAGAGLDDVDRFEKVTGGWSHAPESGLGSSSIRQCRPGFAARLSTETRQMRSQAPAGPRSSSTSTWTEVPPGGTVESSRWSARKGAR